MSTGTSGLSGQVIQPKLLQSAMERRVQPDPVRRTFDPDHVPRGDHFLQGPVPRHGRELAGLRAAEHTAQVRATIARTRAGVPTRHLPLLFCSPTMELGVDIAIIECGRAAQRSSDAGQLRAAQRASRPLRPAGPGPDLLRLRQLTRQLLLRTLRPNGRRQGHAAATRSGERGPRPVARARHLAGRGACPVRVGVTELDGDRPRPLTGRAIPFGTELKQLLADATATERADTLPAGCWRVSMRDLRRRCGGQRSGLIA